MIRPEQPLTAQQLAEVYKLTAVTRHIFICTGPECYPNPTHADKLWNYLKRRIVQLKLINAPEVVFRTRCECLRICAQGPIMVVWPEGIWYHSVNEVLIDQILTEHIQQNRPVVSHILARSPGSAMPTI